MKKSPDNLRRVLQTAISIGVKDWHKGEVVLILKANKPWYDLVKALWMIHLLPNTFLGFE